MLVIQVFIGDPTSFDMILLGGSNSNLLVLANPSRGQL